MKALCSTKRQSDTKWEEYKVKNIKLEHIKWIKYHYCVLMIKYACLFSQKLKKVDSLRWS